MSIRIRNREVVRQKLESIEYHSASDMQTRREIEMLGDPRDFVFPTPSSHGKRREPSGAPLCMIIRDKFPLTAFRFAPQSEVPRLWINATGNMRIT